MSWGILMRRASRFICAVVLLVALAGCDGGHNARASASSAKVSSRRRGVLPGGHETLSEEAVAAARGTGNRDFQAFRIRLVQGREIQVRRPAESDLARHGPRRPREVDHSAGDVDGMVA